MLAQTLLHLELVEIPEIGPVGGVHPTSYPRLD